MAQAHAIQAHTMQVQIFRNFQNFQINVKSVEYETESIEMWFLKLNIFSNICVFTFSNYIFICFALVVIYIRNSQFLVQSL